MTDERRLSTSDIAAADRHETDVAERDRTDQLRQEEERRAGAARSERPDQHGWTDAPTPLFADDELGGYRARWSAIQTGFVDEPRKAVEEADTLVAELMNGWRRICRAERSGVDRRSPAGHAPVPVLLRASPERLMD